MLGLRGLQRSSSAIAILFNYRETIAQRWNRSIACFALLEIRSAHGSRTQRNYTYKFKQILGCRKASFMTTDPQGGRYY